MPHRCSLGFARVASLLALLAGVGCAGPIALPPRHAAPAGGVTIIGPRCAAVKSCLVGQVTAADTATPLARAAVFLEREGEDGGTIRITTLTDDQGVFTVVDAPLGRYRLAIYKDARRVEARGLKLGHPGTTLVPVRLPAG